MTERSGAFLPLTHLSFHLLLVLADGPGHGYALVQRIRERSAGLIDPGTGSFYSIVKAAADSGLIEEVAAVSGDARRREFAITRLGREVLQAETQRLRALVADSRRTLTRPSVKRA